MNSQHNVTEKSWGKQDILYLAGLFLLVALLYLPQLLSGQTAFDTPEKMDITTQWFGGFKYWSSCYREGLFPLWNPHRYAGMPWLIYSHGGMLYIPNLIFYVGFDFLNSVTLSYLFHALVCALGLFILLRDLRLSPLSAFLVSLVFSCSGFYFFLQSQLSNHSTVAWLPLFLLFLRRIHIRPGAFKFLILAMVSGLMIHSGDTEGLLSNIIFSILFIILFLRLESRSSSLLRTFFLFGCALVSGLLMYSAIMLVMLELLAHSIRSSQSLFQLEFTGFLQNFYSYIPFIFFPWKYFQDVHPISDFNNGLTPFYLGALPLLGIIYSIRKYRGDWRIRSFLNISMVMMIYLVVIELDFIAPLLHRIPVIGQMATPERALEQVQLAILIAAAYSFDNFRKKLSEQSFRIFSGMIAAWGILTLVLSPWLSGGDTRYLLGAVLLCLGLIGVFTTLNKEQRTRLVSWMAGMLILSDVYLLSLACVPRTDPGLFELDPGVEEFLDDEDPRYRFISFEKMGPGAEQAELSGLINGIKKFSTPFGHMRLPLHRYFEFLHLINPGVVRDWDQIFFQVPAKRKLFYTLDLFNPAFLEDRNLPLINLLAVRYIFSRGISFKFSSPFSLLNEGAIAKGDWMTFPRQNNQEAVLMRDDGRRALKVELPYRADFESYIHPGSEFAFELKPPEDESFPGDVSLRIFAGRADSGGMKLILSRELHVQRQKEVPFEISVEEFKEGEAVFRLELSSPEPGKYILVIDPRMVRQDMPFQRIKPGPVDIYMNQHALPRAFIVHKAKATSSKEARDLLRHPDRFDTTRAILLERGKAPEGLVSWINHQSHPFLEREFCRIIHHGSQEIVIHAQLFSQGWLFLSDPCYPGWRVWVDEKEGRIYRADYIFRAVYLSEGNHTVRFEYHPWSFRLGLWFSLGSVASLFAMALAVGLVLKGRNKG
jgi:hypothetical protein